jgi:hypothetical protein
MHSTCEQEDWIDRIMGHPTYMKLDRWVDKVMQSTAVNILLDVMDVLLFTLDVYTGGVAVCRYITGCLDGLVHATPSRCTNVTDAM